MSIDTVNDLPPRVRYVALAAQGDFDYPFPIFEDADLVVDVDGVVAALDTDYTVAGEGDDTGGAITFLTPMVGGEIVTIYRDIAIARDTDFQQNGPFRATAINDEFDKAFLIMQELESKIGRALRLPLTAEATDAQIELSPLSNWMNKYVTIGPSGLPEPAVLSDQTMTQSTLGALLYPQTDDETSAGVTPPYIYIPTRKYKVSRYSPGPDGSTPLTTYIANALAVIAARGGGELQFDEVGTYISGKLTIPANCWLSMETGAVLKAVTGLNDHLLISTADGVVMDHFFLDGNYTNQTTGNLLVATGSSNWLMRNVRAYHARGTGLVFSGGADNRFESLVCQSNGIASAGYGLYIFNSTRAQVRGGQFDDNCIGIAVEASGASTFAKSCQVIGIRARNNRADFGQSGAGVHWEQSAGGDASDGLLSDFSIYGSTGVGVNNTACADIVVKGGSIRDCTKTGLSFSAATGFLIDGISIVDCGAGDSLGYRAAMRFDDTGLSPASTGVVSNCRGRGSSLDGFKTLSANSAVKFVHNDVSGHTNNYNLVSVNDFVVEIESNREATITYAASMTPLASAGSTQTITVSNGTAFTINAITGGFIGQRMTFKIRNGSGGVMGAVTWNAIYKMSAWTNPASANSRSITFEYDGTNWVQISQTGVDVPN